MIHHRLARILSYPSRSNRIDAEGFSQTVRCDVKDHAHIADDASIRRGAVLGVDRGGDAPTPPR